MKTRHIQLRGVLLATGGLAIIGVTFLAPLDRAQAMIDLISGLAWPLLIVGLLVLFWPQAQNLATEVVDRTRLGGSVRLGPLSLGEVAAQAERIPSPSEGRPVTLENVALLHTSFLSPESTRRFGDGRTYYQFEVIVVAPSDVMLRISQVTYHLEDVWPSELRTRVIRDRDTRYKMKDLANGTSVVVAEIDFNDTTPSLVLNRFIDLHPDGPRL
jgi:hypothetical protein